LSSNEKVTKEIRKKRIKERRRKKYIPHRPI
jgi:hypothetical protein